jgi:hypothetical protein
LIADGPLDDLLLALIAVKKSEEISNYRLPSADV